jgi:hypothetical protein
VGTPVVASDDVERPPACTLFRGEDAADFARAVSEVLQDLPAARERLKLEPVEDNGEKILAIYREIGL